MEISGKVAFITGGARGLGRAYGEAIIQNGGKVVLSDVLKAQGEETEKELNAKYGENSATFIYGDVANTASLEDCFKKAIEKYGYIDIVINNAGVGPSSFCMEDLMNINVNGVIRGSDLAIKYMEEAKGGVIVNISSIAGYKIHPSHPLYTCSKYAVFGYTASLGFEMGEETNIRAVCLCPSYTKTPLTSAIQEAEITGDTRRTRGLEREGGWTEMSDIVNACMSIIRTRVPNGAAISATRQGVEFVYPDHLKGSTLQDYQQ